jgi:phytanoyl-CoA hydroxylase
MWRRGEWREAENAVVQQDVSDQYRTNGFAVFRKAFDVCSITELARLEDDIVAPYHGPLLRHDGRSVPHDFYRSTELSPLERSRRGLLNAHVLRDSAIQPFVEAFARLLTSAEMFACLQALAGEERFTLHQTIFFLVSPLTVPHLDRMTLDTDPLGHSFTAWIPVDPIDASNGPVFVVPQPAGRYDSEQDLGITVTTDSSAMKAAHRQAIARKLKADGAVMVAPVLNPGDLLVFAPSTPHGSFPSTDPALRRRSVQAIYRSTRFDHWGGYPDHDRRHDLSGEEEVITEHFNVLKLST